MIEPDNRSNYGEDPGDEAFFEGLQIENQEANVKFPFKWWKDSISVNVNENQMRAIGRVMATAMTDGGRGRMSATNPAKDTLTIKNEEIVKVSQDVSVKLTGILRRNVTAMSSHFFTQNTSTEVCRDNLVFTFVPKLLYNGNAIMFHFDRRAYVGDAPALQNENNNDDTAGV